MLAVIVLAAFATSQGQYSIYRELVPKPTGQNGYEEYLMACDDLRTSQAEFLVSVGEKDIKAIVAAYESPDGNVKPPKARYEVAKRLLGANVLQIRREAVLQASRALELISKGNKKPVSDPRETVKWSSGYSEMRDFRALGKLYQAAAYVALAESQPSRATQFILESIRFGQRLSGLRITARLNAIVIQGYAFESVERYLPNLGLKDAALVEVIANEILSQRLTIFQVIESDLSGVKEYYRDMMSRLIGEPAGADQPPAVRFMGKMTAAEFDQALELCDQIIARRRQILTALFQKPESAWPAYAEAEATNPETVNSINSLAELLAANYRPGFATIGKHEAVNRTQLRLIGLAAAVVRFRWENDRLPAALSEAVRESAMVDPVANGQFLYEPVGNGFRVYSRGTKETGEISLKYSPADPRQGIPPPP